MKCLWIAREIPFPAKDGDRIYAGQLARAFGQAVGGVTYVGIGDGVAEAPPADDAEVRWLSVGGGRRRMLPALLSPLPLVAAMHDTPAFRARLDALYAEPWDAIVFDHYGAGPAMQQYLASPIGRSARRARIAYVSHNHEELVLRAVAAESDAGLVKRLGFWQNYWKTRQLERYLTRHADLVTAITPEDAASFAVTTPGAEIIVLTPGYNGAVCAARQISDATPRHVLMIGSFHWAAKQENLRQFLKVADPLFAAHNIVFDVVGGMPEALRAELAPGLKATRLHGFVDDPAPLFDGARLALVPEAIGGGFKLKFLDYLFRRLPVATLSDAAAGLPAPVRAAMIEADTLASLAASVVAHIDDAARLDQLQQRAFAAGSSLFQWRDRGAQLRDALRAPATALTKEASYG
ncbi:glycosyltransferase [Pseudoduganella sp. FT25W]|jgi:glycosyltransferase involved in cell wall biosynthesis|uniref:Glycosyltransferase n=1 Tax=Duganella alba TaxID=2666081 RepID=A0A6L5QME9_9BURK|nr:glycosyltransferase [Duganella alba]MRX10984.1 glycosyltransferase [Duganella alba]MRX19169.1 glycosyltransferase [Duganella alba]